MVLNHLLVMGWSSKQRPGDSKVASLSLKLKVTNNISKKVTNNRPKKVTSRIARASICAWYGFALTTH